MLFKAYFKFKKLNTNLFSDSQLDINKMIMCRGLGDSQNPKEITTALFFCV